MIKNRKSLKWLTVYTKPRHEKKVAQKLRDKNFKVYLPLIRKKSQWSEKVGWNFHYSNLIYLLKQKLKIL